MNKENKEMQEANERLNPFKLINNVEELPPKLKEEVMATISSVLLAADVSKLFTIDMVHTAGKMVDPSTYEDDK